MPRFAALLLSLVCAGASLAQSGSYASRAEALKALSAAEAEQRAEAVIWIAGHGTQADGEALSRRLSDDNPVVRGLAEEGLWTLWHRSGDKAVDELMARGAEQMQAQRYKEAIATYTGVIRRKPEFAEGWNRRATTYFLAGEYRKSLADCDQVIKRNPLHFGALAGYGQIYFALERYDKAIEYWRRALEVNPNMAGVEMNIRGAEQLLAEKRGKMI
jgi:tetratricopeptide (TPR) repeat protein